MSKQDWNQSQYYQEDFLASHSVQPGSDEARRMTVTSGLRCLELYRRSDPVGSLVRMLLGSSAWRSTRCYLTWKASATPAKRLLFRLVPSTPRTGETDAQYWPTPTARDHKGANSMEHLTRDGKKNHTDQLANAVKLSPCKHGQGGPDLATYTKLIPTATTGAGLCGGSANYERLKELERDGVISEEERRSMAAGNGGQLNPTWVEWLMGFPLGWTDLSASETPSCPSSFTPSSGE